jgi:hypothetical protein
MRPNWTLPFLGWLALSMLFISGCNLSNAKPTCRTLDGLTMTLKDPGAEAIVADTHPTLTWNSVSPTCAPDHYEVKLRDDEGTLNLDVEVSGWTTSWTPPEALKVGTAYFWQVLAWDADNTPGSPSSPLQSFAVGAPCMNDETTQAPVILQPADNSVVDQLNPYFTWQNPNTCVIWGYMLEVSTDIQLSDTRLWNGAAFTSMHPAFPLTDCTHYFWRVVPFGTSPSRPASLEDTFYVDTTGTCPAETPGSIGGLIWENLNPDHGYQPGVPVFSGITVHLGLGNCPAQPLLSVLTDASGEFIFPENKPGSYCLWVDASEPDNMAILGIGTWVQNKRSPATSLDYQKISLAAGQTVSDLGFAWHPFLIYFIPSLNAYCRSGPDTSFSQTSLAMKDQSYLIDGRNADDSWYLLRLTSQVECWVSSDTGNASEDTKGIPVILTQQTPGVTPLPSVNPVDCTGYDQKTCNAHLDFCQWVPKMSAPNTGNCINK